MLVPLALLGFNWQLLKLRKELTGWIINMLKTGDLRQAPPPRLLKNKETAIIAERVDDFVCAMRATVKGVEDIALRMTQMASQTQQGVEAVYEAGRIQGEATAASTSALEEVTRSITEVSSQAEIGQNSMIEAGEEARLGMENSQLPTNAYRLWQALCALQRARLINWASVPMKSTILLDSSMKWLIKPTCLP